MKNNRLLVHVQYLRGLAAGLVAVGHLIELLKLKVGYVGNPLTQTVHAIGGAGVDIFFVISGFMMVYIAGDETGFGAAKRFLARRILRVVPLYWLYTLGYCFALNHFLPTMWQWNEVGLHALLSSLFFLKIQGYPVLEVGWTLTYEFYFYVLFALAICVLARPWRSGLMVVLLSVAGVSGMLFPSLIPGTVFIKDIPVLAFIKNPVVLEFAYGVIIGECYLSGRLLGRAMARGAIVAAMLILVGSCFLLPDAGLLLHWRPLIWGLAGFLAVWGAVSLVAVTEWRLLHLLGDISYSLYLSHPVVFLVLLSVLVPSGAAVSSIMALVMFTVVCVSALSYWWVEQVFGKWLRLRLGY